SAAVPEEAFASSCWKYPVVHTVSTLSLMRWSASDSASYSLYQSPSTLASVPLPSSQSQSDVSVSELPLRESSGSASTQTRTPTESISTSADSTSASSRNP